MKAKYFKKHGDCNMVNANFILRRKTWVVFAQSLELEARVKHARLNKNSKIREY